MAGLFDDLDSGSGAGIGAGMFDDLERSASAPIESGEDGNFVRGLKNYIPQTKQIGGDLTTLAGIGMKKALGPGDVSQGLIDKGQEWSATAEGQMSHKETDDFTGAMDKSIGSVLTDYIPYQAGQAVGMLGESLATAGAGAAIGSAIGSAGAGVGAIPGAVAGGITGLIEGAAVKQGIKVLARKLLAEQGEGAARAYLAKEAAKAAAKSTGQKIGLNAGLATGALAHGFGETGGRAIGEATKDGGSVDNVDFGRVIPAAIGHAGLEFVGDKIGLGAISKEGWRAAGSGVGAVAKTAAAKAGVTGLKEAPVEAGQTALERYAGDLNLTDAEARKEYLNSAAAGFTMGGVMGGAGGIHTALAQPSPEALVQPAPTAENPTPAPVAAPDPNAGAISRTAALLPAPNIAGLLPNPGSTLYGDTDGNLSPSGQQRNFDRDNFPTGREKGPRNFGPGIDGQIGRGAQAGIEGDYIPRSPFAPSNQSLAAQNTIEGERTALADTRPQGTDSFTVDAAGNAVADKVARAPTPDYVQGGRGMDQQTPAGKTYNNIMAAKKAVREAVEPGLLEVVKVGSKQFEVRPTAEAQAKQKRKGPRTEVNRERDTLSHAVIRLGGIKTEWRQDTTGDTKGNAQLPGVGALWSDKTGTSIDDMASLLDQHGYVPAGEMAADGGVSWLQAALKDETGGSKTHFAPGSKRQEEEMAKADAQRYAGLAAQQEENGDFDSAPTVVSDLLDEADVLEIRAAAAAKFAAELDVIFGDAPNETVTGTPSADSRTEEAQRPEVETSGVAGSGQRPSSSNDDTRAAGATEEAPSLELASQTEAELAAADAANKARIKAEEKAKADADEKQHKTTEKAQIKAQSEAQADNFTLGVSGEDALSGQGGMFDSQPSLSELGGKPAKQKEAAGGTSDAAKKLRAIVRQSNVSQKDTVATARAAIINPDLSESERSELLREVGAADAKSIAELNTALELWWKRHSRDRADHKAKASQETAELERQLRDAEVDKTLAMGAAAAAEWDTVSKAVAKETTAEPKAKIEDTGDQLKYNKKGMFRSGGLKWSDIQDENEAMKVKLSAKEKIWARPDWEAIIEAQPEGMRDGFTLVAHLVKQVYDGIPKQSPGKSDEALQTYIAAVGELRDAAEALLSDNAKVKPLVAALAAKAARRLGTGGSLSIIDMIKGDADSAQPLFSALFPEQASGTRFARGTPANDKANALDKAVKKMQWGADSAVEAMKAIKKGWPAKQEAWQKQGYAVFDNSANEVKASHYEGGSGVSTTLKLGSSTIEWLDKQTELGVARQAAAARLEQLNGKHLVMNKRKNILGAFDTNEEAEDFARKQTARKKVEVDSEANEADENWWSRAGDERRPGNTNVTEGEFKEAFGFRGVNFGKWVNQQERQQHINAAFDAFHDLAAVLDIPPKAISLNGMLGMAFGAQGGGSAAAHFVAGVNEINLTKTAGAGALAHEWAHGLDHYFGVKAGLGRDESPFASTLGSRRKLPEEVEIRPEVAQAFKSVAAQMRAIEETPEQAAQAARTRLDRAKIDIAMTTQPMREQLAGNAEALAALDKVVAGDIGEYVTLPPAKGKRKPVGAVAANIKIVFDALGYSNEKMAADGSSLMGVYFAKPEVGGVVRSRIKHTDFYKKSQARDGKSGNYWATQWEMFARGFESWVMDKLAGQDKHNNYLVRPGKNDKGETDANFPYPAGDERKAFNQAIDVLTAELKASAPDESGNVALYRLNTQPAKGIPLFSAKAIAKKLNDKLGLNVKVAATEADLPAEIQAQIKRDGASGKVGGVFHNGQSYIVASNLSDTQHAVRLVLHEAIGHGGVQSVLGDKLGKVMGGIYRDMPKAMRTELERRYAGQMAGMNEAAAQSMIAEEYVAHLAETDPQHSVINRLVALLRKFIRDTFGDAAALKWSRNDLVQLLAEARQTVRNNDIGPKGQSRYRETDAAETLAALPDVSEADESDFVASLKGDAATRSFASAMYKARGTESPFFKGWFGKSRMVDKQGKPIAFVHRSYGERDTFNDSDLGKNTGTPTATLGHYLARKDVGNVERYGPVVEQFYIRMTKPKVVTQDQFEAMGDWSLTQVQAYKKTLMDQGFDGMYVQGLAWPVVFEGKNIKAKRNTGTFDETASTRYSLNPTADALGKLGLGEKESVTLADKIRAVAEQDWRKTLSDLGKRANEGLIDGLAGIYNAEKSLGIKSEDMGYVSARMATGLADHMKALLNYGALEWKDGVIQQKANTRGLLDVLTDVGNDDMQAWLGWLGAKRAELLKRAGKENNMTDADIAELLNVGGKAAKFESAYQEYAKLNNAILDLAEGAGLIDSKARAGWMTDYYVPFYRQEEGENQFTGPSTKKGLSHQTAAIKALKGGTMPTKDLLENILTAWTKRVDASIKNKAMNDIVANLGGTDFMTKESMKWQRQVISRSELVKMIKGDRNYLEYWAEQLGLDETANHLQVAHELNKLSTEGYEEHWAQVAPTDPVVIRVMVAGKAEYYRVNDPSLLRGLVTMAGNSFNDPVTRAGRWFKRLLTTGITASPDFMARNFLRDAVHAWVINPDGYKLGIDSVKGLRAAWQEDPHYRELMFAGGAFQGGYIMGNDPEAAAIAIRRALEGRGITGKQQAEYLGSLLLSPAQMGSALKKGWEHYRDAGDKIENANRLATYKAARAAGKSVRVAAYESKDLMDYSMRGNYAAMVWLTDMVPFLNARLQGLGKLGRAMKGDKTLLAKHVAMKGAYIALFSLLLAGMNDDDERYKQLEDWDKDANWHFWFSADQVQPFRIPKPFELGLIFGTIPERMFHLGAGSQGSKDFGRSMVHGLTSTLAFNPIPQFYTPIRDVQANRDFFRDSPIEGMADEGKLPAARYDSRTSETARLLGEYTGPTMGLSPKQLQYLWKGYTGTLGGYVLSMADKLAEQMMDGTGSALPLAPGDVPVVQAFYKGDNPMGTRYQSEFYDMLNEATQISRTVKSLREEGRTAESTELRDENRDKINANKALGRVRQQLGANHARAEAVRISKTMSGEEKRAELNRLQLQANSLSKRAVDQFGGRF